MANTWPGIFGGGVVGTMTRGVLADASGKVPEVGVGSDTTFQKVSEVGDTRETCEADGSTETLPIPGACVNKPAASTSVLTACLRGGCRRNGFLHLSQNLVKGSV